MRSPTDPPPKRTSCTCARSRASRRELLKQAMGIGATIGLSRSRTAAAQMQEPERLKPIGEAQGVHPGRVVWVHDPRAANWRGPGNGHWYEPACTDQERVDRMVERAVGELCSETSAARAWNRLFRHLNATRGRGDRGYKTGEKVVIKPNWVGMIFREGAVDPESYTFIQRPDYMNTSPQMIIALLRQLTATVGVREADITICDTLAYIVHEYYNILHAGFPNVPFVDYAGKFGRTRAQPSSIPVYWSCRPKDQAPDFLPVCFAEAEYVINLASLKAHTRTGVTLCGKNHFGSLVRWPVQSGYYDMHRGSFSESTRAYREQVDLMGHTHLGGKTVLHLIDGLYSGKHPIDPAPRRWKSQPFNGRWTASLLASQDPVAIDSVGFDFLWTEWTDYPRRNGTDDYLHEAALAGNPPSGTFYDPHHPAPVQRLASLGVHEHWNNAQEKKYSGNLGTGKGIELLAVSPEGAASTQA
ncbi:MAG TPA: DUF362 domain-containing protein [Phycisphaerae bacterium]|nr:DUF362 domain-containing protein [Phycisphaerae bacterium]HRY66540.1 DUF362 domain-containing protein [Phycisphaerae bacterium]HSA28652.1 DUF362 domain-containing protein [Phycisphaerae bacterium]